MCLLLKSIRPQEVALLLDEHLLDQEEECYKAHRIQILNGQSPQGPIHEEKCQLNILHVKGGTQVRMSFTDIISTKTNKSWSKGKGDARKPGNLLQK